MDNIKNDHYYISNILKNLDFIIGNMSGVDLEAFSQNEILQDSMMFRLIQISEDAKLLSDGYKNARTDIPWSSLYGLRNRIVHDYGNVILNIVFDTLTNDIPELRHMLE